MTENTSETSFCLFSLVPVIEILSKILLRNKKNKVFLDEFCVLNMKKKVLTKIEQCEQRNLVKNV